MIRPQVNLGVSRHIRGDRTSDLRQRILTLVEQALGTGVLDSEDKAAAESGLLPLFDDLAFRYYLAADGAVFTRDALVPEDGLQPMPDARHRLAVYRVAAEDRPELGELIPARPAGLTDCAGCAGTGREAVRTIGSRPSTTICASCGGTGWVERHAHAG